MKLAKAYEPGAYESDIYALWEKSGAFRPSESGTPFSIVVPPPNANGNLHIGHGLTLAIEDVMIRHHRLKGDSALFVPGADHAGFETWVVYEKELAKQGKSRFDFSRESLYEQIFDFVSLNKANYEQQFRQLGASVDWEHYTYTLDEKVVQQAHATFRKMFEQSLIYRAEKLINYCTFHRTGFADIEVAYEDAVTPLYYMKYGPFELATTRPETKFGDTAVAVHPDDKRYKKYVGTVVTVEGVNGPFEVQVIADEMVDPKFGTGVVKITPAHSFDDWEAAQHHNLPMKRVINHDGTMNHEAGRFQGMTVMEARAAVVKALEEKGLLIKVDKNYRNRVGHCYKCGTVIEPMLMDQWFIDMQPLAKPAIAALKADKIDFQPAGKKAQLVQYLENIRDWNISRQIAWGIPIPAFQNVDDPDDWIIDERVGEEILQVGDKTYHRDPDVFDTWFSSASWPYSTLNFPDGEEFKKFYPLSIMETGADILFPWVSRMLVFGLYNTGEVPFTSVYLHGMVQDEHGQKMSKSKGNVVNPIDKVTEFGSDAFRMGIIADETAGANRPYDESKLIGARNFCNKLWNIARYIESLVGDNPEQGTPKPTTAADHWVLSRLQQSQERIVGLLDDNRFSEAYETLYHLVWDDVADWYVEASKAAPDLPLLRHILESVLLLAHPFAPFLTETIWQTLAWEKDSVLAKQTYRKPLASDTKLAAEFNELRAITTETRFISNSVHVTRPTLYYRKSAIVQHSTDVLKRLAKVEDVQEVKEGTGIRLTTPKSEVWVGIDDDTAKAYREELGEQLVKQTAVIKQLRGRLANKSYVDNAPKHIVEQTQQQLNEAEAVLNNIKSQQQRFGA